MIKEKIWQYFETSLFSASQLPEILPVEIHSFSSSMVFWVQKLSSRMHLHSEGENP